MASSPSAADLGGLPVNAMAQPLQVQAGRVSSAFMTLLMSRSNARDETFFKACTMAAGLEPKLYLTEEGIRVSQVTCREEDDGEGKVSAQAVALSPWFSQLGQGILTLPMLVRELTVLHLGNDGAARRRFEEGVRQIPQFDGVDFLWDDDDDNDYCELVTIKALEEYAPFPRDAQENRDATNKALEARERVDQKNAKVLCTQETLDAMAKVLSDLPLVQDEGTVEAFTQVYRSLQCDREALSLVQLPAGCLV